MNSASSRLPDPKRNPRKTVKEYLTNPGWKSSCGSKLVDYPNHRFSGDLREIVSYLQKIVDDGFTNIYTSVEGFVGGDGQVSVEARTTYYLNRPETDEEWVSRVEEESRQNKIWEARNSARSKLTSEEILAIRKIGI